MQSMHVCLILRLRIFSSGLDTQDMMKQQSTFSFFPFQRYLKFCGLTNDTVIAAPEDGLGLYNFFLFIVVDFFFLLLFFSCLPTCPRSVSTHIIDRFLSFFPSSVPKILDNFLCVFRSVLCPVWISFPRSLSERVSFSNTDETLPAFFSLPSGVWQLYAFVYALAEKPC